MEKRKIYEKNGIAIPTVVIIVVVSIILVAVPTVIIISLINKSMLITESEVDKETKIVTLATDEAVNKGKVN